MTDNDVYEKIGDVTEWFLENVTADAIRDVLRECKIERVEVPNPNRRGDWPAMDRMIGRGPKMVGTFRVTWRGKVHTFGGKITASPRDVWCLLRGIALASQ